MVATARRIMLSVLTFAIRLYPFEKRAWGEAILAESYSATDLSAALSWTMGGLMVAFRAFFSHLLRHPASKNEPALAGPAQAPPRLPWKLSLTCLAISAALLVVPDLRQALRVTYSSWRDEFKPQDDTAMWQKIGREAEGNGNAEEMAVASMRLADPEGVHFEEAVRLAEHAVAKDPSLTWTYYFLASREKDSRFRGSPHPELTQRLQNWDPRNAVSYLAEAEELALAHARDPQWRGLPGFTFDAPFHPEDVARIRGRDPRWRELMDSAFSAPAYDTYFDRRLGLDLQVMQRMNTLDPHRAAAVYLDGWSLPLRNLREYAALRFAQGERIERAGQWENAASEYWTVAQFGQRMLLGVKSEIGNLIAQDLQETSFKHLEPVLLKLGRTQEAQAIAYAAQLERVQGREERVRDQSERLRLFTFSHASAFPVHICAAMFAASLLLVAITLFTFALKRSPRFVRSALPCASLLLVSSCIGLLGAYHPYAEYYRSYLTSPAVRDHELFLNFFALYRVPREFHAWTSWGDSGPIYLWWAIITTASAFGIWLALRAALKTMRPSQPTASS